MLKNYLKIAFRSIWKQRFYAFINIAGLTLGMTVCLLIALFVIDELSFDRFHERADHLYRIVEVQHYSGQEPFPVAVTPPPLAPSLVETYPEIINATRVNQTGATFRVGDDLFSEDQGAFVDDTFFELFSFEVLAGAPDQLFADPNNIILSASLAEKYFPGQNPIGQQIEINGRNDVTVSGVMADFPEASHVDLRYLFPFEARRAISPGIDTLWNSNFLYTYVEVQDDTDIAALNAKIADHLIQNGVTYDVDLLLQPLIDIHLDPVPYVADYAVKGDMRYVQIFSVVALFILLIACINFMNLATARSAKRAREVGVRKAVGARRQQLVVQFLGESVLLAVLAVFLAVFVADLLLPMFNEITGKELTLNIFSDGIWGWQLAGTLLLVALGTGILAGSYPAIFLSSLQPVSVLKGEPVSGKRGSFFRKALVVTQFTISMALIVGTLVVYNQLEFIRTKDLGFNKENIIMVGINGSARDQFVPLRDAIRQLPGVEDVAMSTDDLTYIMRSTSGYSWPGKAPDETLLLHSVVVDNDFFDTMHMTLAKGRAFSRDFPADSAAVILNEEAVRRMGLADPIGQTVTTSGGTLYTIVGVAQDFHFKPVHHPIEPIIMFRYRNPERPVGLLSIRSQTTDVNALLVSLEQIWNGLDTGRPFAYRFLEDDFVRMYRAEESTATISNFFAAFAIFVSALGLFGLSLFMIEQRTKELGIRKVLGASPQMLFFLVSKDFTILVGVALLIAVPISYAVMSTWLDGFAYRIDISVITFVVGGLVGLLVAFGTVCYQSFRAATLNPADALKYE